MVHAHILILCTMVGMASVDLCFDSLILFDHMHSPNENVHQIQQYYHRTRATYIVPLITVLIALLGISLVRCAVYRRSTQDILSIVAFVLLLPYYIFVMEPAEDACLGNHADKLTESELREGLFKVGVGHVLVIAVGLFIALMDLEWTIPDQLKKKLK